MNKFIEKELKFQKRKDRSLKKEFSEFIKVYASNFDFFADLN